MSARSGSSAFTTVQAAGSSVGDGGTPALRDVLELAVAVELVAEKVPETDGLRPDAAGDVRKRALVDLEEPEVGAVGGEKGRRHSRDEIGSRAVVRELHAVSDDLRDHRGGRRLPVGRRDDGRSEREAAGELADGAGVHRGEDLPGNRRAAASAGEPRKSSCRPRERDFDSEPHGSQSTGALLSLERVNFAAVPRMGWVEKPALADHAD